MKGRRGANHGFTLVEVMLSLVLSALLFAAALNLLLGILLAWERAREGDLEADADYRIFAFLEAALGEASLDDGDEVQVAPLPGGGSGYFLNFVIRGSPLANRFVQQWKTERFALVGDRGAVRLVPFVGEDAQDRPDEEDGILLFGDEVELEYLIWEEESGEWDLENELATRAGLEPDVPGYLILRVEDQIVRWVRIDSGEGEAPLW